jgi:hypothetical protein
VGFHETLIQAPLAVNLAGSLNLPPDFIASRVVGVAANNAQVHLPGVYTMSTGSMTFEFAIPASAAHPSGLTISGFDVSFYTSGITPMIFDALPFRLYNWHTHTWDNISFSQSTFSTNDVGSYVSAGGRVLLQLANKDSTLGTFAFSKPLLNLQGTI